MARLGSWIESHPEGIYVRPADAWIDPSQPKAKALVTHGHSDHARGGHGAVFATAETLAIMEVRCGPQNGQALAYDEAIRVGEVEVRFVPAGHVLGSAQIVMEHAGERIVVSGDYKRRPDPTCPCFVPVPCDVFITEATFGLPVFRHPDTGSEIDRPLPRPHADQAAACWSALTRWARRNGSSPSCARAGTTTRSISTARSSGSISFTRASAWSW